MPEAVISDVDGTLCDVTSVRHHVILGHPQNRGYRDYDHFHRASAWCPPIQSTVDALEAERAAGRAVIIVTARMEKWRPLTCGWLEGLVEFEELHMRHDGDMRPDSEVKKDILDAVRAKGWRIVHAYDDNPSIVDLWLQEGIPTTVVPGWFG